jgi:hypothetical protein
MNHQRKEFGKVKRLDMSQYAPYMKMGTSCKTSKIREKKVVWPMTITEENFLGGKFRIRPIGKGDIDRVAELWRESYPEVYGSQHEWILFPEEYEGKVALIEDWEDDSVNKITAVPTFNA